MADIIHTGPCYVVELFLTVEISAPDEKAAWAAAQQIAARHRPLTPRKPRPLAYVRDKEYHVEISDVFERQYYDEDGEPI